MSEAEDRDLLAAEYVLGTLRGEEATEAARLLQSDAAFAASVRQWETRLAPLAVHVAPVEPPAELWRRIAASTASATAEILPMVPQRRLRFWQAGTGLALAVAASLAVFILMRPLPATRVAVLAPTNGGTPVLVATMHPDGVLAVRPNGSIAVPGDRDLELWALAKGETRPRSLGVLPATGRQLTASLAPDTQLLVSLEPKGGSPTGQPTGPVVYGGWLTTIELPRG